MDKVIIVFCVLLIAAAFAYVVYTVVNQFRGRKCIGCPMDCGKKGGCGGCRRQEK